MIDDKGRLKSKAETNPEQIGLLKDYTYAKNALREINAGINIFVIPPEAPTNGLIINQINQEVTWQPIEQGEISTLGNADHGKWICTKHHIDKQDWFTVRNKQSTYFLTAPRVIEASDDYKLRDLKKQLYANYGIPSKYRNFLCYR